MPAKAFAQRLRDGNLTAPSGHYDLNRFMSTSIDDLKRYVDRCIEGAHALGQRTSPGRSSMRATDDRTVQGRRRAPERRGRTNQEGRAAAGVSQSRLRVRRAERADRLRHNPQGNRSGVGQAADGSVLDRARIEAERQRLVQAPAWPVRDVACQGHAQDQSDYTEVGNGTIDFTRIWPDASLAGLKHFFVEQAATSPTILSGALPTAPSTSSACC